MLELPDFGHMLTSTIWLDSPEKVLLVNVMDRSYDTIILRKPRVAIFVGIIKIVTMFIKTIFNGSKKI